VGGIETGLLGRVGFEYRTDWNILMGCGEEIDFPGQN
jgi:hypothetical protein